MSWPQLTDYRDILQHPDRAFKDPILRAATAKVSKLGVPVGCAGGFAIVYKLTCGAAATAVRVFKKPSPEREERYRIIQDHLSRHRPTCLVEFGYQSQGIRYDNRWFPIQTMSWVSGKTLGVWMAEAVARGDMGRIRSMADQWVELVESLHEAQIAHGDLQHGNVMVVTDTPVLVDYDCMTVPTLVGREALESGLPAYQHPERSRTLSLELDHFAAWIILIAMRAVAAVPTLWARYVAATGNENLLFTVDDIKDPTSSRLWPELLASPDPDVRAWSRPLLDSLSRSADFIPKFEIDYFKPLRELCDVKEPDWDAVWAVASGPNLAGRAIPAPIAPKVDQARRRVECRDRLKRAIQRKRPREIVAAYNAPLLDDWKAAAALVAEARSSRVIVQALEALDDAVKSPRDGRALVALWNKLPKHVSDLTEADSARKEAASWKARIAASEAFQATVAGAAAERAIAQAWDRLVAAGGHPDSDGSKARGETARRRAACLVQLQTMPISVDEVSDRKFLLAWDGSLIDSCAESAALRPRLEAASGRLEAVDQLKARIAAADAGRGSETDVIDAAARLPAGYAHTMTARVSASRVRQVVGGDLERILAEQNPSDLALACAWEKAHAADAAPVETAKVARYHLAVRRRDLLHKLDKLPTDPIDEADAHWAALWDDALVDGCPDATAHRNRASEGRRRTASFAALQQALGARDANQLKSLRTDPILAVHPGLIRLRKDIDDVVRASLQVDDLIGYLRRGDADGFLMRLDRSILESNSAVFLPFRVQIESWVRAKVLAAAPVRAATPAFRIEAGGRSALIRWGWDQARLVTLCRVATDPSTFLDTPDQARGGTLRVAIDDHQRAGGGAVIALPSHVRQVHVTVWPVFEVGSGPDRIEWTGPPLKAAIVTRPVDPRSGARDRDEDDAPFFRRVKNRLMKFLGNA